MTTSTTKAGEGLGERLDWLRRIAHGTEGGEDMTRWADLTEATKWSHLWAAIRELDGERHALARREEQLEAIVEAERERLDECARRGLGVCRDLDEAAAARDRAQDAAAQYLEALERAGDDARALIARAEAAEARVRDYQALHEQDSEGIAAALQRAEDAEQRLATKHASFVELWAENDRLSRQLTGEVEADADRFEREETIKAFREHVVPQLEAKVARYEQDLLEASPEIHTLKKRLSARTGAEGTA